MRWSVTVPFKYYVRIFLSYSGISFNDEPGAIPQLFAKQRAAKRSWLEWSGSSIQTKTNASRASKYDGCWKVYQTSQGRWFQLDNIELEQYSGRALLGGNVTFFAKNVVLKCLFLSRFPKNNSFHCLKVWRQTLIWSLWVYVMSVWMTDLGWF